jgi:hypothetical protein
VFGLDVSVWILSQATKMWPGSISTRPQHRHVEVSAARKQIPELGSERPLQVHARTVMCMQLAALPCDHYHSVVYYYTFVSIPNRWALSPHRVHIKEPE